ncbi:RNA polymerase sigma factor [Terrimonas alba]|uniref:RNA polymerase sigma factor n=1 Tax=Terrimonas alba TaxID=3349636 RepID=UPI0035F3B3EC
MTNRNEHAELLFRSVCSQSSTKDYEELYKLLCNRLIHFSASIIGSFHQAEEIVSDVFISIWQKREQLSGVENPIVFLYVCTKNLTLNALKKTKQQPLSYDALYDDALSIVPDVESHIISTQVAQKIENAIRSLPARCQLIFRLVKMDGLRYKEVAELMEISPKTVDAQLAIAVKKVAETIRLDMSDEMIAAFLHRR